MGRVHPPEVSVVVPGVTSLLGEEADREHCLGVCEDCFFQSVPAQEFSNHMRRAWQGTGKECPGRILQVPFTFLQTTATRTAKAPAGLPGCDTRLFHRAVTLSCDTYLRHPAVTLGCDTGL